MKQPTLHSTFFIWVLTLILLVVCTLFLVELVKKALFAHQYYLALSENNLTRVEIEPALRGVFFDRDGVLLAANKKNREGNYQREYFYPEATAHLLGYLSLPDEKNSKSYVCGSPPLLKQMVGKTGLERYFECRLRGVSEEVLYEVDASGEKKQELAKKEAQPGENITLALSLKMQQAALKALKNLKGGVIFSNPKNGEVYTFYSAPSFNPDIFFDQKKYQVAFTDPDKPLFNRLTLGVYPPGSVIKPLIALAALEEKEIDQSTLIEDTGIFKFGNLSFGNWYYLQYGKKEEPLNVVKAIARSNDIFFYKIGLALKVNRLYQWFNRFGLGDTELANYFVQAKGTLPNEQWKINNLGESWYLGDTVNLSIGQGYLLVNPVQLHMVTSTLANNGEYCHLQFEKKSQINCDKIAVNEKDLQLVKQGMRGACATGGTAWPFFDFRVQGKKINVACKTGTAEAQEKNAQPHAWFTFFYPVENPEIVGTVFVENGGEGSNVAAPIAKEILKAYLTHK